MNKKELQEKAHKYFSLKEILEENGLKPEYTNNFFCPFHDDVDQRSASYYQDNHVYCFAERKQYDAYDALKFLGYSDEEIADMIPEDIEAEKKQSDYVKINQNQISKLEKLKEKWKKGQIEITSLNRKIVGVIENGETE